MGRNNLRDLYVEPLLDFRWKLKESGNYYGANGILEIEVWPIGREWL